MELRSIHFSYGEQGFIKDLSANIENEKITTIIGPNGCGKSTLLNLLVNQLKPKNGQIFLENQVINSYKAKELAKKISIVYQQNQGPNDITVEKLVRFGRSPYQGLFSNKDEEEEDVVAWALEVTKLTSMANKPMNQLSGGERQRAWIAMSLAQKTNILFLDEPTTYLDIYFQYEILNLVKELNQRYGMTIVMVLHDINQAIQYSHNIIIIEEWRNCLSRRCDARNYPKKVRRGILYPS